MMMSNEVQSTVNPPSHLVVVGASAGGIEALSGFVSGLPTDLGAPIVIAQHLSRNRNSSLSSILESRTSLRVQTVETSAKLSAATIYVVPANRDVLISDHEVSVVESDSGDGKPSVDLLFRSAAAAYQENLVAVVLSGTGSDGAAGAQEVKNAGGTIIIQNPETATFPGMPRSLPQVLVDAIAGPVQMGALLRSLFREPLSVDSANGMWKFGRSWPSFGTKKALISPAASSRPSVVASNGVWPRVGTGRFRNM
jgi:two-component system CheB/CheR fusion protein